MLALNDFIGCSNLYECEVEAIAEHEHVPMTVAAEISQVLLCTPEGVCQLHTMIIENMQHALDCGQLDHEQRLVDTYSHLQRTHPLSTQSH